MEIINYLIMESNGVLDPSIKELDPFPDNEIFLTVNKVRLIKKKKLFNF